MNCISGVFSCFTSLFYTQPRQEYFVVREDDDYQVENPLLSSYVSTRSYSSAPKTQEQEMEALLTNAKALQTQNRLEFLNSCQEIRQNIQNIQSHLEKGNIQLEVADQISRIQSIGAAERLNDLYEDSQSHQLNREEAEKQLQELEKEENELRSNLEALSSNKAAALANVKKAKKKRKDGLLDLIPGRGIVKGIKTGNFKRIIPLYSTVLGAVSVLKHDKETHEKLAKEYIAEHRLVSNLITTLSSQIEFQKSSIQRGNDDISRFKGRAESLEKKKKQHENDLVSQRNHNKAMKSLHSNYRLLISDLETMESAIRVGVLPPCLVDDFIQNVAQIVQPSQLRVEEI